jgi:hypothetical protein
MRPTTAHGDNIFDLNYLLHPGTTFEHPRNVVSHPGLSLAEKRAVLASWASDASAIASCPSLRAPEGLKAPVVNKRRTLTSNRLPTLTPPVMHFSSTVQGLRKYLPGSSFGADRGQTARRMTGDDLPWGQGPRGAVRRRLSASLGDE